MRVLVDTNILLRSAQPNHPLNPQATHPVSKLLRQKDSVFFGAQNIAEFWNVATRPAEVNGLGLSHEEALQEVSGIETCQPCCRMFRRSTPYGNRSYKTTEFRA